MTVASVIQTNRPLEERIWNLQKPLLTAAVRQIVDEALQPLAERLESLIQAGAVVQARSEELAAATLRLQEADSRHDAEIHRLQLQLHELSGSTRDRINEICHRIEEQERQISTANSTTSDLSAKIEAAAERLERHASVIRLMNQEHQQRAAALDQVAEVLVRIRTAAEAPQTMAAL